MKTNKLRKGLSQSLAIEVGDKKLLAGHEE